MKHHLIDYCSAAWEIVLKPILNILYSDRHLLPFGRSDSSLFAVFIKANTQTALISLQKCAKLSEFGNKHKANSASYFKKALPHLLLIIYLFLQSKFAKKTKQKQSVYVNSFPAPLAWTYIRLVQRNDNFKVFCNITDIFLECQLI